MARNKKTFNQWQKSGLNRNEFLQRGDEIDEEMYLDILECVSPEYSSKHFGQNGEPEDTIRLEITDNKKVYLHETVFVSNNFKYYYLGALPSFDQLEIK